MTGKDRRRRVLEQFVQEARASLQQVEQALAVGSSRVGEADNLQQLFRSFHSIKGISGFADAREIGELSHEAESLLREIQAGRLALDGPILELLLTVHDELIELLKAISTGSAVSSTWEETLARLCALTRQEVDGATDEQGDSDDFSDVVNQQLAGLDLYLARLGPGPAETRLARAVLRKLALIGRSARAAGRLALEQQASAVAGWFETITDWPPEQVAELRARAQGLAGSAAGEGPTLPLTADAGEQVPVEAGEPAGSPPDEAAGADRDPRVPIRSSRLHQLSTQIEELVVLHNRLVHHLDELAQETPAVEARLRGVRTEVDRVVASLKNTAQRIQMVELSVLFDRVPRMVRQIARDGGKDVSLTIHGADTEVDRAVVDLLGDPLTHIVKNAIDHGIEPRAERAAMGKPAAGALSIHAYAMGKHVFIDISDDGRGIDPQFIRQKAVDKGFVTPLAARRMSDAQLIDLIYAPGFSSSDEVSQVSGRGVGMDAVLQRIREMGGQITIKSEVGAGATIRIILPNSFSLVSCLVLRCGEHLFAVPVRFVKETVRLSGDLVERSDGQRWIRHKGKLRRIWPLEASLEGFQRGAGVQRRHAFVMTAVGRELIFAVDQLVSVTTLSIRSLPAYLESRRALAGVATVGGGALAFFLHTMSIIESFARGQSGSSRAGDRQ